LNLGPSLEYQSGMKSFFVFVSMIIQSMTMSTAIGATKTVAPKTVATKVAAPKRITHAKELLGKNYKSSVVRKTEKTQNINVFITKSVRNLLPKAHQYQASTIARSIIAESERYGFDPIFLMAVIQNESSFNPRMKGSVGEIGLMQIKPDTAKWIAELYKIKYKNEKSLYQPETNIKIGAAFLNKLRNQFDANSTYYLTAYNAGAGNVRKMISENVTPKTYATAVMKRYSAIYSALGSNKGNLSERADRVLASVISATTSSKN